MAVKKYPVISSGEILPGYEREKVSSELAELLRVPKEIISESLLNGSPQKLQSFVSRLAAETLISKLRAAGLKCSIPIDENTQALSELFSITRQQEVNNNTQRVSPWIVIFIILVVVVFGVFIFL